jgi:hypothetical protein
MLTKIIIEVDMQTGAVSVTGPIDSRPVMAYVLEEVRRLLWRRWSEQEEERKVVPVAIVPDELKT